MRVLVVRPGPQFSVADVHRGWMKALGRLGCSVVDFNFDDRLDFYTNAKIEYHGDLKTAFDPDAAVQMAAKGIEVAAYEFWPDLILIISAFYVPPDVYQLLRARGHKIVILYTESPYEDDKQIALAPLADVVLVNDPTNLERFHAANPKSYYIPHAYDPEIHYPGPPIHENDVVFVGTGFPSRINFLERVDWSGLTLTLGGNWASLPEDHPLCDHVGHRLDWCLDNTQAAALYRTSRTSLNLYRKEAEKPEHSVGWAMGPREVELAACGTFFLREPRPEGDELFPMLPTFTEPDEVRPLLDWWLTHDGDRQRAATKAREAISDRTFVAHAQWLLDLLT